MKHIKKRFKKFEAWFNANCSWFFTNGRKIDRMQQQWNEKYLSLKDEVYTPTPPHILSSAASR